MVEMMGFEPTTPALRMRRKTACQSQIPNRFNNFGNLNTPKTLGLGPKMWTFSTYKIDAGTQKDCYLQLDKVTK